MSLMRFLQMTITIKKDLHLTTKEVSNSNILALTATLIVRFLCGPACDRWGPRRVFAGLLLLGAVPTALAGTVTTARGLLVLRFFVGVLGGVFVPCQVWCTGFFDKNVVGSANALAGGWGNAGGGITYFVMPAIFDSLVHRQHMTPHTAWRVAFIVPFILITSTAIALLLLCDDTPVGKWSERHLAVQQSLDVHHDGVIVDIPSSITDKEALATETPSEGDDKLKPDSKGQDGFDREVEIGECEVLDIARGEVIQTPTWEEALPVIFSLQSLTLAATYFCSFGGELAINSILGSYYLKNFPHLGQTGSGRWAAMFGLLNVVTRPAGGFVGDLIYRYTHSLWAKKFWIHFVGVATGVFLIAIGITDSHHQPTLIGLVAGMAFFHEAGNGANFALVPHVHPFANGIVSGLTGAAGNLGGIIFAIIFRYNGTHYARVFWISGIIHISMNLCVSWIRPIPKGQIGGR
ncbi:MAG: hypothetical protein M1813_008959 [Trichoglossum hirsutum]|nr:MAG: hypothetical protein M1813_008959 [Trichoglossum hirsutum]